eukprot:1118308-Prymnesium_polylepis.1
MPTRPGGHAKKVPNRAPTYYTTALNARGLLRPYSPAPFRWSAPAVGEGRKPPAGGEGTWTT